MESTPQPGTYTMYEPTFDALEFDHRYLEDAKTKLDAAQQTRRKSISLFRLALTSFFAVVIILIATFFVHGLGSNAYALRVLILFGLGGAARYVLIRRHRLQDAARTESTAQQELKFMELHAAEAGRLYSGIHDVLLNVWDPIGVKEEPNAQDEYDLYIGRVYELLVSAAPDSELAEYLHWVAHDRMGFDSAQLVDMTNTVQALRAIPLHATG